ncbi:DUF2339 domain-containing protein [Thermosynechococcus sp. PP45]|uniref:DUF2339 domain-containing protein n=1 Tax=unclassified Thermosynechococcus TaxID=2622553 RepID=UPI00267211DA|nr:MULTISPECIES: DUF2339 domain-containing protein [unclassified Thermosynechococcus]WKT81308.1 DUF2339 domain-containing protein [Thermosynechococcus sp. PP45]WNC24920.1 DUF2339 domain-containing protein [Thermosynechococcus sp. PP551]WNC27497.1 DUF2339 domain-containing protein [Thermosynechococcus sp. PP555]
MEDRDDLRRRLENLEAAVAALQRSLEILQRAILREDLSSSGVPEPATPSTPPEEPTAIAPAPATELQPPASESPAVPPLRPVRPSQADWLQNWELWLNRLGIGLLLLGIGFLFRYAVELGWITDAVLVAMGFVIGTVLMGLGWRLQQRAIFSQFLQGGGLATYYLTIFAAYQVLTVMPWGVAFPLMVLVTLGAFFISLRQNRAIFAVIGVVGGLATPLLLYNTEMSRPLALASYTFLILLGSWAIYAVKGWRSLLLSAFWLGWLMLTVSITAQRLDRVVALQIILALTWLGFTVLPPWYQGRDRDRAGELYRPQETSPRPYGQTIALFNPLIALGLSAFLWDWSATLTGRVFVVFGVLYLGTSLFWRHLPQSWRWVYSLTGLVLIALGIVVRYYSNRFILAPLAIEGLILHYLSQHYASRTLRVIAHLWWGLLGLGFVGQLLFTAADRPPLLNLAFFSHLVVLGAAAVSIRFLPPPTRPLYWILGHGVTMIWMQHELAPFGTGAATLVWGLFGVGLLIYGLRRDTSAVRTVALITLIITLVRLFFVDLIHLAPVWRVLLFMGFGLIFLLLSYFFRALWRRSPVESSRISEETPTNESEETP